MGKYSPMVPAGGRTSIVAGASLEERVNMEITEDQWQKVVARLTNINNILDEEAVKLADTLTAIRRTLFDVEYILEVLTMIARPANPEPSESLPGQPTHQPDRALSQPLKEPLSIDPK